MRAKDLNNSVYQDLQGFGYRPMDLDEDEIEAMVLYQIGAVNSFAKAMALEVSKNKMRVNCIQPGFVPSGLLSSGAIEEDDFLKFYRERHPLGFGTPTDIANCCIYLLSEASRWVTGSIFTVDGGYTLQ